MGNDNNVIGNLDFNDPRWYVENYNPNTNVTNVNNINNIVDSNEYFIDTDDYNNNYNSFNIDELYPVEEHTNRIGQNIFNGIKKFGKNIKDFVLRPFRANEQGVEEEANLLLNDEPQIVAGVGGQENIISGEQKQGPVGRIANLFNRIIHRNPQNRDQQNLADNDNNLADNDNNLVDNDNNINANNNVNNNVNNNNNNANNVVDQPPKAL